ncbi:MAG: 3-deoxy-7-phosphoheptulonate synthase [Acidobacteriota bacterium]|nr:3-deoxy-7-phosphoheptulonate synthase [Acidobacteriota bacterium]MDQ7087424.1 3-deoxy-7-phosphoheptulonate synthase [Acidobacteriota bacterium]
MIVWLEKGADASYVQRVLADLGLWALRLDGPEGTVGFSVQPWSRKVPLETLRGIEGVASVAAPASSHRLVDAATLPVEVAGVRIGGSRPVLMAGPCSVETPGQIEQVAGRLAARGVTFLRGGAFKPRSSPYAFQGHGEQALAWLRRAADAHGLKVVTEALSEASVPAVAEVADLIQVGSRNMHNSALLQAIARRGKAVLLKRGMAATVEEWLQAGEYLLFHGASAVVFCERGIRSFDASTRNLLDLGAVALLRHVHQLPVVVDPSHALGRRDLMPPLARAALAAGAAGLLVEIHPSPGQALSDGPQALRLDDFDALVDSLETATPAIRTPPAPPAGRADRAGR